MVGLASVERSERIWNEFGSGSNHSVYVYTLIIRHEFIQIKY